MGSLLITLEGNSLTGKSTAMASLAKILQDTGADVLTSREPGGTPKAEALRQEISALRKRTDIPLNVKSQLVLEGVYAARKLHIEEVVAPHLGASRERRSVMLIDRFIDSTFVYQYLEGGADLSEVLSLNAAIVGDMMPDLTLLFYLPEEQVENELLRRQEQILHSRAENEIHPGDLISPADYLRRQGLYMQLPEFFSGLGISRQFAFIDASLSRENVIAQIVHILISFLELHTEFRETVDLEKLRGREGELGKLR